MSTRKELKQQAKAAVAAEKATAKLRKEERAAMPAAERRAARRADKKAAKLSRKTEKAALKDLPKPERKQTKRLLRMEKKIRNRPRRLVGWGIFGVVVVGIGVVAAPFVGDFARLMSIEVDTDGPEAEAARAAGEAVAEEISNEGIVLLKNDDAVLPLAGNTVNVFGFDSFNMRFGGGGSGAADQSRSIGFYEGLSQAGIQYNTDLHDLIKDQGADDGKKASTGLGQVATMVMGNEAPKDPAPDYLTAEAMEQAKGFSDVALIVFGNDGVEMKDFEPEELRLTAHQEATLAKVAEHFDDIVVVINSGNTMELGFLDEYPQVKGALTIATAGPAAGTSLARTLTGELNPSGRTTDTFAYSADSAPAAQNFGSFKYDNVDRAFLNYAESIYVGYRFYETFYEGDEAGYNQAVQFPFGYGLSYTTFDWDVADLEDADGTLSVAVEVENTGDVEGKEVVQVYYSAPYIPGGIEKSAINLAGFAKTELLQPGEKQTVEVSFPQRDMSSWDKDLGAYVLDEGEYQVHVSTDVHSPVASFPHQVDSKVVYDADPDTGTKLSNQFEYAAGDVTYLSRADWEGTYPNAADANHTAPQYVVDAVGASALPEEDIAETFTQGVNAGIDTAEMRGLAYDDPKWQPYLDQFTVTELKQLFRDGGYQIAGIERLGLPSSLMLDGPAGINFFFGNVKAASYPTAVVIASTWNEALAQKMGETVGKEANVYGVPVWYAPGMNIHRSALGGRNFEYYSEDPLLSGRMGARIVEGAQSQGVVTTMKHFLLNDQEVHARTGINIWADEQALREIYLKPFEITFKQGKGTGVMSSFVHLGTVWAGANEELLFNVLRDEWGFEGMVTTDAVLGSFMDIQAAALHGSDLMLDPLPSRNKAKLDQAYKKVPNATTKGLRTHAHNVVFALVNSAEFE